MSLGAEPQMRTAGVFCYPGSGSAASSHLSSVGRSRRSGLRVSGNSGAIREHWGAAAGSLLVSRAEGVMGNEEEASRFSELLADERLWRWQILLPRWKQKSKGVSGVPAKWLESCA